MNVAETVALALLTATAVRCLVPLVPLVCLVVDFFVVQMADMAEAVDVADGFRARVRLPGVGVRTGAGGPTVLRRLAVPPVRHREFSAAPAGSAEQLWGSV